MALPPSSPDYSPAPRRVDADSSLFGSSPTRKTSSSVSVSVLLPDSGDELSDRIPLLSSLTGSTPYSFKLLKGRKGQDPFDTPSHTESSNGDRSFPTPSTELHSTSSASMEIFLGPQPLSFVHHRRRVQNDEFPRSPVHPALSQYTGAPRSKGVAITMPDARPKEASKPTSPPPPVSRWRREQIKKFKPGRPVNGARERPIPLLHGPLSLPYARNPSGVDATVADQSSYMSHVFGLRTESDKHAKTGLPRARIVSDPTNARSTSGSSYLSAKTNLSSSVSEYGGTIAHDLRQHGSKSNIQLGVPIDLTRSRSQSHSDLRSQLGFGKPLSTIPASPIRLASAPVTYDDAIHSASSNVLTLSLVDPVTNSIYNVRVPKAAQGGNAMTCELVPLGSKTTLPSASSKADVSKNWRSKSSGSHHVVFQHTPKSIAPPPPTPAHDPLPRNILTLDSLYEKFGDKKNSGAKENVSLPASASVVERVDTKRSQPKALTESTGRQVNTISSRKKSRAPSSKKAETSSPQSHRVARAKGTPGAGMHLKRTPIDAEATPSRRV